MQAALNKLDDSRLFVTEAEWFYIPSAPPYAKTESWGQLSIGHYSFVGFGNVQLASPFFLTPHKIISSFEVLSPESGVEMAKAQGVADDAGRLKTIELLQSWMKQPSNYDKQVWPRLKQSIEENRTSDRRRFDE